MNQRMRVFAMVAVWSSCKKALASATTIDDIAGFPFAVFPRLGR
jgi:hypothetical protein